MIATSPRPDAPVLSDLDDTELALAFQQGCSEALDHLARRYRPLVRSKSRMYYVVGGDRDDVEQEALIGLYKAARDFVPERTVSFRAFADLCVTRQIITAVKGANRGKHRPLNTRVRLEPLPDADSDEATTAMEFPGPAADDPCELVASADGVSALRGALRTDLTG